MKRSLLLALVIFVITLLTGCKSTLSQENSARIYYESLDLGTPESAVKVFTDAFQREDYYTVFLVLSPSTQLRVENNINTLNYEALIKVNSLAEAEEILVNTPQFQVMGEWEHFGAVSIYLFDGIMLAARQHAVFLIDLSEDVSILHSQSQDGDSKVDVYTTVEGIEGEVVFRMEQAPSGRWRVRQVIVPGGDNGLIPWSVSDN